MEFAVKRVLGTTIFKPTGRGGGGCISSGVSYVTDNGQVFVKINGKDNAHAMFLGEKLGLEAILTTNSIRCPKPFAIVSEEGTTALVMESMDMTSITSKEQEILGEQLANMHLYNTRLLDQFKKDESSIHHESGSGDCNNAGTDNEDISDSDISKPVEKFGFYVPTSCGYLSQDNSWQEDWTTFYIRQKLQPHVDMLNGDRELNDTWPLCRRKIEGILSKLDSLSPALLHGDLWSGNIGAVDGVPVVFDPACFFGHSEYDFGIAQMFGGFSSAFYNAYFNIMPKASGFSQRVDIYELFHHLNHWNHFGSGYRQSTLRLMKKISKL